MADDLIRQLSIPAEMAAPRLLGCRLVRRVGDTLIAGRIVETEAYSQDDVASHSYRGETPRTKVMFGPAGHLYVYFTYGMHYCCNVVTGPDGHGSAVLIRALEPLEGHQAMSRNRRGQTGEALANGPAKLCQALEIGKSFNGHDLHHEPLRLVMEPPIAQTDIVQTTRIGISRGQDVPWRFYIRDNPYVSGP
ncbi:MAG TPA: DNA-3-methyladenine glycosylase [Candidatus Saccharimonadales bacterium]|jgi:DNA-3-methyladenine glycosylase|nr:DNA-3-methyladenine glycosylase [Candidatus Saccharimonadales bacterium]